MKLFIFEGQKREPRIFKTIQWLYFKENDQLIFMYGLYIFYTLFYAKFDKIDNYICSK